MKSILPYIAIARPDHWFKNVFMVLGVVLVFFYDPSLFGKVGTFWFWSALLRAVAATCLVASSNYVLNEILDAPSDRSHPTKKLRPIPSGRVNVRIAAAEWILLACAGIGIAAGLNLPFMLSAFLLWFMGLVYNIPPIRSKELPYIDVLSESVNNPIRLLLGWYALTTTHIPPISLLISYWMLGAFFMAAKRWAEYRQIGDKQVASAYRRSFRWYTLDRLMISMFFYSIACGLFTGVFIVRYHLELILSVPFIAGFFAYYLKVTFLENSPVQTPELLYKQTGLMVYLTLCTAIFFVLMFVNIPLLYEILNVQPVGFPALWTIGH